MSQKGIKCDEGYEQLELFLEVNEEDIVTVSKILRRADKPLSSDEIIEKTGFDIYQVNGALNALIKDDALKPLYNSEVPKYKLKLKGGDYHG